MSSTVSSTLTVGGSQTVTTNDSGNRVRRRRFPRNEQALGAVTRRKLKQLPI
jgi:hypothetical protein